VEPKVRLVSNQKKVKHHILVPTTTTMYSEKLKNEFEPVLKFFDVKPTGNIFQDITSLAETLSSNKHSMNDKLTRYFFDYYDVDGNGEIDRDEFKRLVKDIGQALG